MFSVASIFVQGPMPVMFIVFTPVLLVTLLIAVSPYEVYILTYLFHVHMNNLHMYGI